MGHPLAVVDRDVAAANRSMLILIDSLGNLVVTQTRLKPVLILVAEVDSGRGFSERASSTAMRETAGGSDGRFRNCCKAMPRRRAGLNWEDVRSAMQDLTMLLFTVIFFAVAFLYVRACQKLR